MNSSGCVGGGGPRTTVGETSECWLCLGRGAEQGPGFFLFSGTRSTSSLAPLVRAASIPACVCLQPFSTCPEGKSPVFRNREPDSLCSPGGPNSHTLVRNFTLAHSPACCCYCPWLGSGHLTVPSTHSHLPLGSSIRWPQRLRGTQRGWAGTLSVAITAGNGSKVTSLAQPLIALIKPTGLYF